MTARTLSSGVSASALNQSAPRGEDARARRLALDEKGLERGHIRLGKFPGQRRAPAFVQSLRDVRGGGLGGGGGHGRTLSSGRTLANPYRHSSVSWNLMRQRFLLRARPQLSPGVTAGTLNNAAPIPPCGRPAGRSGSRRRRSRRYSRVRSPWIPDCRSPSLPGCACAIRGRWSPDSPRCRRRA